jgi:ABC-type sugar transport systems, permease components
MTTMGADDASAEAFSPRSLSRLSAAPFFVLNGTALILILAFSVLPVFYVAYLSTLDIKPGELVGHFVGFSNYSFVMESPSIGVTFRNTLLFSTCSVVLAVTIGAAIAFLMDSKIRFRFVLMAAVVLPWAVPEVVNALVWKWIFDYHWGALNAFLKAIGVISTYHPWLSDATTAIYCLIFAYSWKLVPFVVVIIYAALRAIPEELVESGQVDGATAAGVLWHIRLPLVTPAVVVATIFCVIFSMRAFDLVYLLTKGGPGDATSVLSYYTYVTTFEFGDVGAGSAVSVMLAVATLAATVVYWRLSARLEQEW